MSEMFGSDRHILGGRYVFRDPMSGRLTRLPIGTIKSAIVRGGRDATRSGWPYLTDEQLDFALAFDFPAQGPAHFWLTDGYASLDCACGDPVDLDDWASDVPCVCKACNRSWIVTITVEEAPR